MRFFPLSTLFAILLLISCTGSKKLSQSTTTGFSHRIAFYNVENLFDTVDDPIKMDDDFTPEGRQKWDQERYQQKLSKLHKIVRSLHYPSLLGLCEIENATVLQAFSDSCKTSGGKYRYVHFESADFRGIDVALMYDPASFKVSNSKIIRTEFPLQEDGEPYTSRDILQVAGTYQGKYPMYVFVNHWPSRRGGLVKSEPKRLLVAQNLRKAVDEVMAKDPGARIVILGDFNDEPDNKSMLETLGAAADVSNPQNGQLYNHSYALDAAGKGTYNYRGNWNCLDQMVVSGAFLNSPKGFRVGAVGIFREDWMMFDHEKYGLTPSRTYGGPNYYGGYSDHLPIYADLLF